MQRKTLVAALIVAAAAVAVAGLLLLRRGGPEAVPEPRTTIEQALDVFVRERFGTRYAGTCLQEFPPDGDIPRGMCSAKFSGTPGRAVYGVGHSFSEWAGEATLVRDASGSWRVASFEGYPPLASAPESPPPSWEGPPPPDESGVISVTEFTEYQDATDPAWADSPARIALEFLDLGDPSDPDQGAFTTTVVQEASPEGGEQAEVTVTLEGLLDDSVQAIRYALKFQKDADGAWRLASATWAQRCAPGRGHQDFSLELCI
jgi:hypothetical protein